MCGFPFVSELSAAGMRGGKAGGTAKAEAGGME